MISVSSRPSVDRSSAAFSQQSEFGSLVRRIMRATSIAAACSAGFCNAHAADVASNATSIRLADVSGESSGITTVTVTARRREENIQDVPIPIAALGGDVLEKGGQFRLEDLNQRLPSTNVFVTNPRQTSIAVRGLGNNLANDALESSVGVYLDNVYLGRPGMANFDLVDIDQVALLRGPQGTLFGKNTTAGVLNISTRKPSFTPEATIETTAGDDSYWQVRGAINGPLSEHLAGRLSAVKTYRDGYINAPLLGNELNESNREGVRGQLLWDASDDLQVRFIGDYNHESSDCCVSVIKTLGANNGAAYLARIAATGAQFNFDPNYRTVYLNSQPHMNVKQGGYSVEANWQIGESTLTSISAYRYWDFEPSNDADGTSLNAITNAAQLVNDEQWSQELRWASASGRTVEYVAGLYYFYQAQDNTQFTQYGPDAGIWLGRPAFNNGYSQTDADLHARSSSLFGQATWNITDAFSLTGGLRYTTEKKNTVIHRLAPTGTNPAIALALPEYYSGDLERTDDSVSALLSASYKLSPDVLLYASASRGVKSGGVNPAVPPSVPGGLPINSALFIEPETALDYELGLKSSLLANRVQLNANLFWTDVEDYQSTLSGIVSGVSTQVLSNVGAVRTRGVEIDVTAKPLEGLTLALSTSFNDAIYADYKNGPCAAEKPAAASCDLTGERVYLAPRWIANPSVDYEHKIGALTAFTNVNYAWRSSYLGSSDSSQLAELDSFGILNARIGVRGAFRDKSQWSIALWANNALDETYFQSLSRGGNGEYVGNIGLPRTYGATVRIDL
jgi:iron complex outermembrane receptor protein